MNKYSVINAPEWQSGNEILKMCVDSSNAKGILHGNYDTICVWRYSSVLPCKSQIVSGWTTLFWGSAEAFLSGPCRGPGPVVDVQRVRLRSGPRPPQRCKPEGHERARGALQTLRQLRTRTSAFRYELSRFWNVVMSIRLSFNDL